MNSVLTTEETRDKFAQKYAELQRMLEAYGRRGFVDINCTRSTLLRDVFIAFQVKHEMQDPQQVSRDKLA